MSPLDERAAVHIAQVWAATVAQWAALIAGAIAALWHGPPAVIVGGLAFWFLGMAKPPPDSELDKATGRGPK